MNAPIVGQRIRLLAMPDDPNPLPAGATGTVLWVTRFDDWMQIAVAWDQRGGGLMLSVPPDRYEVVDDPMRDAEERRTFANAIDECREVEAACQALDGHIEQMGGGTTAWWFTIGARYALVTHYEADHMGPPEDPNWMAGLYEDGMDQVEFAADLTLEQALERVKGWKAVQP